MDGADFEGVVGGVGLVVGGGVEATGGGVVFAAGAGVDLGGVVVLAGAVFTGVVLAGALGAPHQVLSPL